MTTFGQRARRALLGVLPRAADVHVPGPRPSLVLHRKGDQWGVAMLHGGRELAWMLPPEARRYAADIVRQANLACRPGELPAEDLG